MIFGNRSGSTSDFVCYCFFCFAVLVFSYQVSSTITTAKLFLLFVDVARDERKLLFYLLLVGEALKQRLASSGPLFRWTRTHLEKKSLLRPGNLIPSLSSENDGLRRSIVGF